MKEILNILGFEYMGYARSKAFRITTLVFVIIIIIASLIPQIMGVISSIGTSSEKSQAAVIVSADATKNSPWVESVSTNLLDEITEDYEWSKSEESDPVKMINTGDYSVVLVLSGSNDFVIYGSGYDFNLYSLQGILETHFSEIQKQSIISGLEPDKKDAVNEVLSANVTGEISAVSSDGTSGASASQNFWLSYVMLYVLFMVVTMYGQFVVNSVVLEKSTKAMELLITSAKPTRLMYGKVFGVGLAAMTQLLIIILAVTLGLLLNFKSWESEMPMVTDMLSNVNLSIGFVIFFILFFVAGYFVYAFIYAALASTVSRIEDAGSIVTLPMLVLVIAFIVSIASTTNIDAMYVKVLSYIPFFSPFIMFSRLSMGEAGVLEAGISLAILLLTIVALGWLAARIYRMGVMMYGKPMKLGAILKLATQK